MAATFHFPPAEYPSTGRILSFAAWLILFLRFSLLEGTTRLVRHFTLIGNMIVSASVILQRVICILCAERLRLIHFLATIAFSSPPNDNLYKTRKLVAHQYCTTNRIYIALSSISNFQLLFRKKIGYSGPVGSCVRTFKFYYLFYYFILLETVCKDSQIWKFVIWREGLLFRSSWKLYSTIHICPKLRITILYHVALFLFPPLFSLGI